MFRIIDIEYPNFRNKLIDEGDIADVITFAKNYNIFQENGTKAYNDICAKIKARLDREGLSYDTVRPD